MVSPRKRILADRPKPLRRQGSKLGAVKLTTQGECASDEPLGVCKPQVALKQHEAAAGPPLQQMKLARGSQRSAAMASDAGFSDWSDNSFGFEAQPRKPAAAPGRQRSAKPAAKPASPNLLGSVQRGFKALLEGEAYVAERDRAASSEPSFLNKGLDAFNAVSRAAVGVATSLDTHIEQLMDQHGWTDRSGTSGGRAGRSSARDGGVRDGEADGADSREDDGGGEGSGGSGVGGVSFLDFGGFDAGASLFGAAAAVVVGGGEPEQRSSSWRGGRPDSSPPGAATAKPLLGKSASPGVAEKAAASVAALLPAGFRSKETVSEFLSEVWGSSQLGSMLSIEPADAAQQLPGSRQGQRQEIGEWGVDSGAYSSVGSENGSTAPTAVAGRPQRAQRATEAFEQMAASPTADKENQVATLGGGSRKQQHPAAVDWQDFLSSDSQVLQPSSCASSVCGGGSVGEGHSHAVPNVHSPQQPPTPQQHQHQPNPAAAADEGLGGTAATGQNCGSPPRPAARRAVLPPSPGTDPISEQVRSQLEALITEKAALAQENARLQRENCGLQELLSYTMAANAPGSGSHMGSDDEDALSDWSTIDEGLREGCASAAFPSVDNGVSPVKMRRRLSMGNLSDEASIPDISCAAEAEEPLVSELLGAAPTNFIPAISAVEAAC